MLEKKTEDKQGTWEMALDERGDAVAIGGWKLASSGWCCDVHSGTSFKIAKVLKTGCRTWGVVQECDLLWYRICTVQYRTEHRAIRAIEEPLPVGVQCDLEAGTLRRQAISITTFRASCQMPKVCS